MTTITYITALTLPNTQQYERVVNEMGMNDTEMTMKKNIASQLLSRSDIYGETMVKWARQTILWRINEHFEKKISQASDGHL
jgi:hypothetical protein